MIFLCFSLNLKVKTLKKVFPTRVRTHDRCGTLINFLLSNSGSKYGILRQIHVKICILDCIRVMINLAYTVLVFYNVLRFLPTLTTQSLPLCHLMACFEKNPGNISIRRVKRVLPHSGKLYVVRVGKNLKNVIKYKNCICQANHHPCVIKYTNFHINLS